MSDGLETRIRELAQPIAVRHGVELVDIIFRKRVCSIVRLTIDYPVERGPDARVSVDTCASVSRELGTTLEVEDIIDDHYVLEVTSPGLDRPLKSERDFLRHVGQDVVVHFHDVTMDERTVQRKGKIAGFEAESLVLALPEETICIPMREITSAKIDISF